MGVSLCGCSCEVGHSVRQSKLSVLGAHVWAIVAYVSFVSLNLVTCSISRELSPPPPPILFTPRLLPILAWILAPAIAWVRAPCPRCGKRESFGKRSPACLLHGHAAFCRRVGAHGAPSPPRADALKKRAYEELPAAGDMAGAAALMRFHALSSLLWRCIAHARRLSSEQEMTCHAAINNCARL